MTLYTDNQYYEAIIQIRPKDKELETFIKNQIEKNDYVFISKEETKKYGIDLYINSLKFAKKLAPLVKERFKVKPLFSTTLFGMKDGRRVYRLTVLFRLERKRRED
ncbi:hypothetical protein J4405_02090 [Candidatus Woesearchaeota archaeon]|nr:hypothetical protein [Candidatus Woesearchaeota archaeon]